MSTENDRVIRSLDRSGMLFVFAFLFTPVMFSLVSIESAKLIAGFSGSDFVGELMLYILLWAIVSGVFTPIVYDIGDDTMLIPYVIAGIAYLVSFGYPFVITSPAIWWLVALRLVGTMAAGWTLVVVLYVLWRRYGRTTVNSSTGKFPS